MRCLPTLPMPGLDGRELLRYVLANHSTTPVIVISGLTDGTDAGELLNLGAFACFTKPFRLEEIEEAVERAIARHQELAAASSSADSNSRPSSDIGEDEDNDPEDDAAETQPPH